jgi:acetate---CoA ligase (ADP-forming)
MLCDDPRVTAFGLYLEGIKDPARFARGRGARARRGQADRRRQIRAHGRRGAHRAQPHRRARRRRPGVRVFLPPGGLARCDTLSTLVETLKVFHAGGPLAGKVLIMGASGGDMAMTADVARSLDLEFAPIPPSETAVLRELLTRRVTVANPFDIHTYLWFDPPALGRVFATVLHAGFDAVGFMLDCPPDGKSDTAAFDAVIDVFIDAARGAPTRAALIASLPETLGARIREHCLSGGVVPLQGQREALEALAWRAPSARPGRAPGSATAAAGRRRRRRRSHPHARRRRGQGGVGALRHCPIARGISGPAQAAGGRSGIAGISRGDQGDRRAPRAQDRGRRRRAQCAQTAADAQAAVARLAGLSDTLAGRTDDHRRRRGNPRRRHRRSAIRARCSWSAPAACSRNCWPTASRCCRPGPESIEAALASLKVAPLLAGFRGKPPGDVAGARRSRARGRALCRGPSAIACRNSTSTRSSCGPR